MRLIRRWLLVAGITLVLVLPLGSIASADPGNTGFPNGWSWTQTAADPGDTGFGP